MEFKDYKIVIIKMFQWAITCTLETNDKIETFSKEVKIVNKERVYNKEEPKRNFRTEKYSNQNLKIQWTKCLGDRVRPKEATWNPK